MKTAFIPFRTQDVTEKVSVESKPVAIDKKYSRAFPTPSADVELLGTTKLKTPPTGK